MVVFNMETYEEFSDLQRLLWEQYSENIIYGATFAEKEEKLRQEILRKERIQYVLLWVLGLMIVTYIGGVILTYVIKNYVLKKCEEKIKEIQEKECEKCEEFKGWSIPTIEEVQIYNERKKDGYIIVTQKKWNSLREKGDQLEEIKEENEEMKRKVENFKEMRERIQVLEKDLEN